MTSGEQLIRRLYDGFNHRDMEGVLAALANDVAWANGMEGTYVHGRDAVRDYWTYQWSVIDPSVEPLNVARRDDGSTIVEVHQLVRDLQGRFFSMKSSTTPSLLRVVGFSVLVSSGLPS